MEYCCPEVGDENKENQNVMKTVIVGSSKFSRQPLQQLNNPSVCTPQGQPSLTPYRPRGTSGDALPNGDMSPFAYPHILEPYQSASSPSTSYSSPVNSAKMLHEVNCSSFESPKTSFSTPLRKINPGSSAYGSCSVLLKTKSESSSEKERSKLRGACTSGTYARGGPSSSHSGGSHANSSSSLSHLFSVGTPSKSAYIPSPSSRSVFLTPSSTYTSSTSDSRLLTPQHRCQSYRQIFNPFEVGVDCLQLPTVSPSLFQHVVSPSQETSDNFRWTIDQLASLQPANIDTSPLSPGESFPDPDYEKQAQAAIDKFFSQPQVVPSPWTGSHKQINLLEVDCALTKSDSCEPTPSTRTVCCQTELSLPAVLPEQLEEMLKPFLTCTQDQWWQVSNDLDEGSSLNNTTLRRKLLFSQDELMNATPICSPRNTNSSEGSTSSSSMRPLPFHDDDDDGHIAVEDDDDDEGSVWCKDIIRAVSSSAADPNLRRCPPPTPPTRNGHELSHSGNINVELSETSQMLHSPSISRCSPNVSPIKSQLEMSPVREMTLSSPDISPIWKSSDKISVGGCHNDMSMQVFKVDREEGDLINSPDISPFLLQHKGSFASTFPETRNPCDGNQNSQPSGAVFELDRGNDEASAASHKESLIVISQENKVFISDSEGMHKQNPLSETLVNHISVKNIQNENEISLTEMDGTVKRDRKEYSESHHQKSEIEKVKYLQTQCASSESCDEMKSVPSSPKPEKRSSGNMSHFSSSPIREGMQMPLVIDTACAKFSESPPLSPIFCRSILVQSQPEQLKSHLQKIKECHFTTRNLDQSTLLSVDMEGRSGSEDEIMMEEGIAAAAAVPNLGNSLTSNKLFIPHHEYSSVCEMDTDSQQSLEVNVSHEGKSLESGYQTGSLQSTNFNITSFTSNSTIGSMTSFQRDRQVIICGTDTSSVQCNIGRNPEKIIKSQASVTCKDHM